MKIINITGEKFDFLDCSESNIFLKDFQRVKRLSLKYGVLH